MQIKELYIENFGKLSKYRKSFTPGINSILEENGFGKTTLSVFIKVMLYGFEDTKKISLDENERKRYTPWQGGHFGGWLVFSALGNEYRVERTFGQKASDDTFTLYNLDIGKTSTDFSENLGEELLGIDSDGFERTVFLSEKNLKGKNNNQTISAKLSNIVEVEGDIGGFDNAIKLLDERRKFYQKKGGSGEIHDLEEQISNTEAQIRDIKDRTVAAAALEAKMNELTKKANAVKEKKNELLDKQRRESLEREQHRYQLQYMEMIGALKIDEERENSLLHFFEKKIPSNQEIGAIADCLSEAARLEKTLGEAAESSEFSELKEFFKRKTTEAECDEAVAKANRIEERKSEYTSLLAKTPSIDHPFKILPEESVIAEKKRALSGSTKKASYGGKVFLSLLGIIFAAVGIYTGNLFAKPLYALTLIGGLLTIVSIFSILKGGSVKESKKSIKDAVRYCETVYGKKTDPDTVFEALDAMAAQLAKYNADRASDAKRSENADSLLLSITTDERALREFIESFPVSDTLAPKDAAIEIRRKFLRYSILRENESENDTRREIYSARIRSLKENAERFLNLFPTVTDSPIDEIRNNLAEYDILHASLTRRRSDCDRFARLHSISGIDSTIKAIPEAESTTEAEIALQNDTLLAIERERSDLKVRYNNLLRDTDKLDELEGKLIEDNEKIAIYLDNLSVIKKTMEMLAEAKSNMTAKYLEPTRNAFAKYLDLMDDEDTGEFTMDTSFTITKTDLGKSRQAEAYSRGTRDLHSLAIRFALIDSLYGEEKPPIILDDPFTSFDDRKTDKALSLLKKLSQDRQIIYLTCSRSRKAK